MTTRVPIEPVLRHYGYDGPELGPGWKTIRCLFHEERDPSARANEHGFICNACGVKGDAIALVMRREGFDFNRSLGFIAGLPGGGDVRIRGTASGSPGSEYLSKRGITSEVAASFRLGYVAEPLLGDDHLKGRIAIPYLTPSGVVGLQLRDTALDTEKKYLPWRAGLPGRPFNVSALQQAGVVYVTEGEIDAITATAAGLPAVGFSGSNKWKPVYGRIFRFRRVVILADGDDAGWKFAETLVRDLEGSKIISMPAGEDVNSVFCARGAEGLRKLVSGE